MDLENTKKLPMVERMSVILFYRPPRNSFLSNGNSFLTGLIKWYIYSVILDVMSMNKLLQEVARMRIR